MMLTALYCELDGITFVAVHDSFWTHPCDIEKMGKICRHQFVKLHSEKILNNLSRFFVENYGKHLSVLKSDTERQHAMELFKAVPEKGSFKLEEVLKSTYFFS